MALALRVNDFLVGLFLGIGIRLIDFKMEFGRLWENEQMRIVLADEISPDCCRLWDVATSDKLDKDRFRRDLGGVLEAYQEVARRLGVLTENPRPKGADRCWSAPNRADGHGSWPGSDSAGSAAKVVGRLRPP